jgi:hypothetical protein
MPATRNVGTTGFLLSGIHGYFFGCFFGQLLFEKMFKKIHLTRVGGPKPSRGLGPYRRGTHPLCLTVRRCRRHAGRNDLDVSNPHLYCKQRVEFLAGFKVLFGLFFGLSFVISLKVVIPILRTAACDMISRHKW